MVSQALVQSKVYYGLGKAAAALGASCPWYRPNGVGAALASPNQIGTMNAGFQIPGANYMQPSRYAKAEWWGLFDGNAQVGDYLIEPRLGTFFIASLEPIHYPQCIRCNATLTFSRPGAGQPGLTYYGGDVTATETPLITSWPASVLQGTKGNEGELRNPGDLRLPWFIILLPPTPGVELLPSDMVKSDDAIPRLFTLSSCELSALGWRLTASLANP